MNPQMLIDDLATQGIRLALYKGQIEVSGAREAVSADIVACLRSNKPEIIRCLTDELLNRAAEAVPGVTADDLRANLDREDWRDSALIAYEPLKALAHCIRNTNDLAAGKVPKGWDAITECSTCGPVPIAPGGSKTVLGCPWCFAGALAP